MTEVFHPHDDQKEALAHLYEHDRCGLFMRMGGGKTVVTLTALLDHDLVEPVFPILILAPKRVARTTWPDEVAKWAHTQHLKVSVIDGTPKQRERCLAKEADVYTMAYDNLVWLVDFFGEHWPFETVVADELTRLKGFRLRQGTKRAQWLSKVAFTKIRRFIGLSGTPAPNGVIDLWGQVWFLDKGYRLGRTFTAFEQRWFRLGRDGFKLEPMEHTQAEVQEKIRDICLTIEGEPVDEPVLNKVMVKLPTIARALYVSMQHQMWADIGEDGVAAANPAVRTNKCLQLANGAAYVDEDGNWEMVHNAKLEALESIIEEAAGMPVLVAYAFQSDLKRILHHFPHARHLDADPQTIHDWNAGKIELLVAHPASAGHGLNLADGGNILAFFGLTWSLEHYMQIIERIGPKRQKQAGHDRPVYVHLIMAEHTVDELVYERIVSKRSVQDILLDALKRYNAKDHVARLTKDYVNARPGGRKNRRMAERWGETL